MTSTVEGDITHPLCVLFSSFYMFIFFGLASPPIQARLKLQFLKYFRTNFQTHKVQLLQHNFHISAQGQKCTAAADGRHRVPHRADLVP